MTDIRTRLADALREELRVHDVSYAEWQSERLADVLLALPGIAIVDAEDIIKAVPQLSIGRYYRPSYVASRGRLLAAADAAEADQ